MIAARAIITEQGGSTSHAAVVSRALGRPCVVGIGAGGPLKAGDIATVDGAAGIVYAGTLAVDVPQETADDRLAQLIRWARARCKVTVIHPAEAGVIAGCVDVDDKLPSGDRDQLPVLLAGAKAARGSVLADPQAARVAASAGVLTIVTEPVLPALLAIVGAAA